MVKKNTQLQKYTYQEFLYILLFHLVAPNLHKYIANILKAYVKDENNNDKITVSFEITSLYMNIPIHAILAPRKMGGQFYWILGDLKFSPTPWGLSQMGGLKFFTLLREDNKSFLNWGMEGESPPTGQNLLIFPPTGKVPPVDSPHKIFISSPSTK